jgi:hypothetical protein
MALKSVLSILLFSMVDVYFEKVAVDNLDFSYVHVLVPLRFVIFSGLRPCWLTGCIRSIHHIY